MYTYTLEVTGRQIISLVVAISKMDEYLKSEGVVLDPPAGPMMESLMQNIIDMPHQDLTRSITITVDAQTISAAYATSMNSLTFATINEPSVREDLQAWASCTAPMVGHKEGYAETYLN